MVYKEDEELAIICHHTVNKDKTFVLQKIKKDVYIYFSQATYNQLRNKVRSAIRFGFKA